MKSSGMNLSSGTRTRSVRFRGFTFALVLLSTCACTGTDHNVTAQAGQPAVLPCTCPPDQYLVWQRTVDEQTLVVDHYKGEEDQKDIRAQEYRGRTELKLTENCSLKILNVTQSDQGLYTCYYQTGPIRHDNIFLEVKAKDNQYRDSEKPPPEELWSVQKTVVVCVLVIVIIAVAIAVYVGIIRKNIRQMNGDFIATSTRSI